MHYITLDYQMKWVWSTAHLVPSNGILQKKRCGYLSRDLQAWPMWSCDLTGHAHRSHGTYHSAP